MGRINVTSRIFEGPSGPNKEDIREKEASVPWVLLLPNYKMQARCPSPCMSLTLHSDWYLRETHVHPHGWKKNDFNHMKMHPFCILAEGAIALSVTLSGGALFASWKLLQFPSSLIVKVILAIFMGASAQQYHHIHSLMRASLESLIDTMRVSFTDMCVS